MADLRHLLKFLKNGQARFIAPRAVRKSEVFRIQRINDFFKHFVYGTILTTYVAKNTQTFESLSRIPEL